MLTEIVLAVVSRDDDLGAVVLAVLFEVVNHLKNGGQRAFDHLVQSSTGGASLPVACQPVGSLRALQIIHSDSALVLLVIGVALVVPIIGKEFSVVRGVVGRVAGIAGEFAAVEPEVFLQIVRHTTVHRVLIHRVGNAFISIKILHGRGNVLDPAGSVVGEVYLVRIDPRVDLALIKEGENVVLLPHTVDKARVADILLIDVSRQHRGERDHRARARRHRVVIVGKAHKLFAELRVVLLIPRPVFVVH